MNNDNQVSASDALDIINYLNNPAQSTAPFPPVDVAKTIFTYVTPVAGQLPRGLVLEQRVATGRSTGDIVTRYDYVTTSNTPGATPAMHGKLRTSTVGFGTAEAATTLYAYDTRGNLTSVTDPLGRITKFFYDGLNRIVATLGHDPDGSGPLIGAATRFTYDVFNNVVASETINSYLEGSKMLVTATKTTTTYNKMDQLLVHYEQNPNVNFYLHPSGSTLTQTNAIATATAQPSVSAAQLEAFLAGNAVVVNTPDVLANQGLVTSYGYNSAGDLLTHTQTPANNTAAARQTTLTRDILGRVTRELGPDHGTVGLTTTSTDRRISNRFYVDYAYDNLSNLTSTIDERGGRTTLAYDNLNRITSQIDPSPTAALTNGAVTTFAYTQTRSGWVVQSTNANGQVVRQSLDMLGRPSALSGDTPPRSWLYWTDGNLRSEADGGGQITTYDYTRRGQLMSVVEPTIVNGEPQPITNFTYFADGRLNTTTDPLGRTTTRTYRPDGLVASVIAPDPDGAGPLAAAQMNYTYDAIGNLRSQSDALANSTTTFGYDSRFRRTSITDPRLSVTSYKYTLFDELNEVTDPLANVTSYIYNNAGNLITERQVVSGVNRDRTFSYDGSGNLRNSVDRNGNVIQNTFDLLNRITQEDWRSPTNVLVRRYTSSYDAIGNLTALTDNGTFAPSFAFTYDTRNQLQIERHTSTGIAARFLDHDYDNEGKRINVSLTIGGTLSTANGGSITGGVKDLKNTYFYDNLDRLTGLKQETNGGNVVQPKFVTLGYNLASEMTGVARYSATSPAPANLEASSAYNYDAAGRVSSILHSKDDVRGTLAWNGTSALPSSVTAANVIGAYAFAYDADNRLTSLASYADRFNTSYVYDNADQLTSATSLAIAGLTAPSPLPGAEGYNLDENGNRRTSGGVSQSASGTHNRLQTDGTFNYLYDNEGNVTRKTAIAGGAYTEYGWDHRNRLTSVIDRTSAGAITKQSLYQYDAFDRRVLDRSGGTTLTRYDYTVYNGEHAILALQDNDGIGTAQGYRTSNRYLHGNMIDQVFADEQYANGTGPVFSGTTASTLAGTTLWTLGDHLGSIRDVVDNAGVTRQHVVYDSFGKQLSEVDRNAAGTVISSASTAAIDTIFSYTGREWDKDTNLQNNRARWYDPNTGRWLSQDPIGFAAGDANLYRYVGNQPTTNTDPSGLETPEEFSQRMVEQDTYRRAAIERSYIWRRRVEELPLENLLEPSYLAELLGQDFRDWRFGREHSVEFWDCRRHPNQLDGVHPFLPFITGARGGAGFRLLGAPRVSATTLPWSNPGARQAAIAIENGARVVNVSSRNDAAEVVWRMYSSQGFGNTSFFDGAMVRRILGDKSCTYHWDDVVDELGRVSGHGAANPHGSKPHVQIHLEQGELVRIFFPS